LGPCVSIPPRHDNPERAPPDARIASRHEPSLGGGGRRHLVRVHDPLVEDHGQPPPAEDPPDVVPQGPGVVAVTERAGPMALAEP
jgi:hypothetical protein